MGAKLLDLVGDQAARFKLVWEEDPDFPIALVFPSCLNIEIIELSVPGGPLQRKEEMQVQTSLDPVQLEKVSRCFQCFMEKIDVGFSLQLDSCRLFCTTDPFHKRSENPSFLIC